jgi:carbamate kinase
MPTIRTRVAAAAVLPAVATMLFVQACGGGGFAVAADPPDPIEGVWEATVTQRDCTTSAALATMVSAR